MLNKFGLLIKPASAECNMACTYCFYHGRPTDPYADMKRRRMSDDVLREMISQYMNMVSQASLSWQGGEPMLMGLDYFQAAVNYEMKFGRRGQIVGNSVQTNGVLINDEWAEFFRKYNFLIGISLDGPKEFHDEYRIYHDGRPTFDDVMKAVKILTKHGVEFNTLSVVNNTTMKYPEKIYDWFVEQGFQFLQFIPAVEKDPTTGEITWFSVSPEGYADFLCGLFDRWWNNGNPQVSIRIFDGILSSMLNLDPAMCLLEDHCGDYVVIEYNGDVYPCDFFVKEELILGNLMETPLTEIVQSDKYRWFRTVRQGDFQECKTCRWNNICHNACPRYRYVLGGFQERSYLCESFKRFLKYSNKRFKILRDRLKSLESRYSQMPNKNRG